ncbi:hypothetical protein BC332_19988 [Capsicum chinense]|nr:hypothetical protein BC332_19988 [Capsicum chinense]
MCWPLKMSSKDKIVIYPVSLILSSIDATLSLTASFIILSPNIATSIDLISISAREQKRKVATWYEPNLLILLEAEWNNKQLSVGLLLDLSNQCTNNNVKRGVPSIINPPSLHAAKEWPFGLNRSNFLSKEMSSIESARLYFQHKPSYPPADVIHSDDSKTSGYHADPQQWQENYDFRPGLTPIEPCSDIEFEFPPAVCCHARPSFQGAQHHGLTTQEAGQLGIFSDHEHQVDRSLVTIVKSDKPGLHATAGYISPELHRTDIGNQQGSMYGRCSLSFKLMPKSMTNLNCSEMRAAGHGVEAQFQLPVPVDDFMQRSTDQLLNRNNFPTFNFPTAQEGSMKPIMRRRKSNSRSKPLPPSKRLRLEAQRVLKERVQDIADKKGIKLRFCTLKDCENHIQSLDSPCTNVRMEIGWPPGVPFVHPHDLPNKAKIGFLETYEPGWSATHDMELSLIDPGQPSQHTANCNYHSPNWPCFSTIFKP